MLKASRGYIGKPTTTAKKALVKVYFMDMFRFKIPKGLKIEILLKFFFRKFFPLNCSVFTGHGVLQLVLARASGTTRVFSYNQT